MDVLFCVEIDASFGERVHALSFAQQIAKAGYRPHFVVTENVAKHFRTTVFQPIVADSLDAMSDTLARIDPAMVIGCELFNLSNDAVQRLVDSGKPIGSMDGTTLGFEVNSNPFKGPEFSRSLSLPERFYAFRPCPVNDIAADTDTAFHFALFPDARRVPRDPKLWAAMGLDPGKLTLMFAIAPWALGSARHFDILGYYDTLLSRIVATLQSLGRPAQFVVIARRSTRVIPHGSVSAHMMEAPVPYHLYDHLLCSCDAILSDNIIQTSVSKAVVMGTPHLIIQNTIPSELPFPCNMFPIKQLFPQDREYARIVDVAEFGDPEGMRDKLLTLMHGGCLDAGVAEQRQKYLARLRRLSAPADILAGILGPATPPRGGS